MISQNSWKQALRDFFQLSRPTLAGTLDDLHSGPITTLNTCDDNLKFSTCTLWSNLDKKNFEGITLIWFDPEIYKTEDDKLTIQELREINDCVLMCSDQAECVQHMQSVKNEKIFLITSGNEATSIIEETKQLKQVDSIFIFCLNIDKYEHLLEDYKSIVGIYNERSILFESIRENIELLQRQLDVFSLYNEHKEKATRDISKETAEFLWFQLFKDVLPQMSRDEQAKQELVNFCRSYYRGNRKEHKNILEFEQSYQLDKTIYWYTKDSFLYRLVNKALRTEDIGQLFIFRFFINDLSLKLAQIHQKQNPEENKLLKLYRGFKMENDEITKLKQNLGSIISANGFLSTSLSKEVAITFAKQSTKRSNIVSVLYEIECNLNTTNSIIFADITKFSDFAQEEEVLFDLGSTFKIESIDEDEQLKIVLVKLTATDAGMEMAQKYIELNRKMNEETTPDILFGILLNQMGKYDQSLNYFANLLTTSNGKVDTPQIYSSIGSAYLFKGELDQAYEFANNAYQMMIQTDPTRIKHSTKPMTVIAHVYLRKEMYQEALDLYFEVLEIREKFYGEKHLDTAVALNHIGNVYYKMKEYSQSLSFYQRSLEIREEQLPHVHLDIAASLNNIGLVYWKGDEKPEIDEMMSDQKILEYFQESLNIRKQILPTDHNDIMQSLKNITQLLYEMRNFNDALKYFADLLTIQKIQFDSDSPAQLLCRIEENFGRIPNKESKAKEWPEYSYFACMPAESINAPNENTLNELTEEEQRWQEEQQRIEQKKQEDLPVLNNFIETLRNNDDYTMALETFIQVLKISQDLMHFPGYNHNQWLMDELYQLIANAQDQSDQSNKDFHFYEKLQLTLESAISKWVNTDDVQILCLQHMGRISQLNENYQVAVDMLEKSLQLHGSEFRYFLYDIETTLCDLGLIYMILSNQHLALSSFEKAFKLLQENPNGKDQKLRLISKRMEQIKEALKSTIQS